MKKTRTYYRFLWVAFATLVFTACSSEKTAEQPNQTNEAEVLLTYLESHGNIVNQAGIPYFIMADELYNNLNGSNYHVIDVRKPRDFTRGHIAYAVNVQPHEVLDYFENRIEPNSFEKIAVVCNNGHLSGYVVAILRMLGYDNTFNMKFGMSSWHNDIARRYWYANISDDLIGRLETAPHPKNPPEQLPELNTGESSGYEILHARAEKALAIEWEDIAIDFMDILEQKEDYYIINYWPQSLYDQGHLPGAVQYNPKKAFHSEEDILTLPTNRPLVVYCFTGQNASYANAFLALMGYEIRSLDYGANSFIHNTMVTTQQAGRSFSEMHVRNYPLVREGIEKISTDRAVPAEKVEVTTAQGGC
ncbi:MAG: rhodanese-like domain-containing protein [Bacteroidota bacterium]